MNKNILYSFNLIFFQELMHERKLNINQVADKAELPRAYVRKLKDGKMKYPSADAIARLADLFIVRMEELMIKEGNAKKEVKREENWKRVSSL